MTAYECSGVGCDRLIGYGRYCSVECKYPACLTCGDTAHGNCSMDARQIGAAVAFGLMGMALAIDEMQAWCAACQSWRLDCTCPYIYAAPSVSHATEKKA